MSMPLKASVRGRMQARLLRPVVAWQLVSLMIGIAGLAVAGVMALLNLEFGSEEAGLWLLVLDGLFATVVCYVYRGIVAEFRWGTRPVLSFDEDGLSATSNFRDVVRVPYANVTSVEVEARSSGDLRLVISMAHLSTVRLRWRRFKAFTLPAYSTFNCFAE